MSSPWPLDGVVAPPSALTKVDFAYRELRREIVEGVLPANSQLDQEALAARLGLSTTPVREALRRLESERLIVSRAHRSAVVAPLSFTLLEETYTVRVELDPLAVRLAAANATAEQLQRMSEFAVQPRDQSPVNYLNHNRRLHRAMYGACGNAVLVEMLDVLWDRSDRYRMITLSDDQTIPLADREHSAIIAAVTARKGERAAGLMRDHIAGSFERISKMPHIQG